MSSFVLPADGGEVKRYAFDPLKNRGVAVNSAALMAALEKIYKASRLAGELRASMRIPRP